jgi:PAS domain S-box-containing protein
MIKVPKERRGNKGRVGMSMPMNKHRKTPSLETQKNARLLDLAHIFILDMDSRFTLWNTGAEKLYGWRKEEAVGLVAHELLKTVFPEPLDVVMTKLLTDKRWQGKLIHTNRDGKQIVIASQWELFCDEHDNPVAILEVNNDITDGKQAEEALRESEIKFRSLVEQIPDTIIYTAALDERSTTLYVSPQIAQIFGYTQERFKEDPDLWGNSIHPDDRERVMAELEHSHKTGEPFVSEYRMIRKDGRTIWFSDQAHTIKDEHGKPLFLLGINTDITERKEAQEALQQSAERYRKQFEEAIDAIFLADLGTGMLVDCNIAASKLVEREKSELIGKHQSFLHPAEDIKDGFSKTFKSHMTGESSALLEDRVITKSRQIKDVAIRASKITIEGKEVMQGIFRDITKRKQAEEALKVREKELEIKTNNLEEINTALNVLLKKREEDKTELEEKVLLNIKQLVEPYISKLKQSRLDERQKALAAILESNLKDITSSFSYSLSSRHLNLTPREVKIANLIKQDKTSKEICEILGSSEKVVAFHRQNIRRKLGLQNKKVNLKSYLIAKAL